MWRTFWRDISADTKALDEFLNLIEADGFQPVFIRHAPFPHLDTTMRVYVTARKKE